MRQIFVNKHIPYGIYEKFIKRPFDFLISLMVFILFFWVYIIVGILVFLNLGKPVLFKQSRPGRNEYIFTLYKFRTMTDKTDINGNLLPDTDRLTRFGRFLRKTSLDEIPELFNIIKGDMSLVGPRPLLVEYLPYYITEEHRRHDVRPGLTGLAQVNGRNASSWKQKFHYDLLYVDNITFINDVKIIIKTFKNVIIKKDILVGSDIPAGRLDDSRKGKSNV